MDYSKLITENRNLESMKLDELSSLEAVTLMNRMDSRITEAVEKELPHIAEVIDHIVEAYNKGGKLVYCGAGTSGRLGVLDASECLPTFGAGEDMVTARIAGGFDALHIAVEGAEDDEALGESDMKDAGLTGNDVLIAISASGSAAYCIGALKYARSCGAYTAGVSCVPDSGLAPFCDTMISVIVGPEILTGSTRLRSGTATKMVLNMLTTVSMVKAGKVYKNLMVDMIPTNKKLEDRAVRIIQMATGKDIETSRRKLEECNGKVKAAVVCLETGVDAETAEKALIESHGYVRDAIKKINMI